MVVGETGFVSERLTEVREARGLNQSELAEKVGVNRASISHYEAGKRSPETETLRKLANVLGVPRSYFFKRMEIESGGTLFYRSLASATKTDRRRAERRYGWLKELTSYLRGFVRFPRGNLPGFGVSERLADLDRDDIALYATRTRDFWGLGGGPISDVMLLLENNGVIVSKAIFESKRMDGYSGFDGASATPYVIIAYDKGSAVRSRFDLAHELGHMVLHRGLGSNVVGNPANIKVLEAQANTFAGEFLMPSDSFEKDVGVISLDALKDLKRRWGVSIGAMLYRLGELGWVSDEQSARFWQNYSRRGWRKGEPLDDEIQPEYPRLLRRGVEVLVDKGVREPFEIADELCLSPADISELACLNPGFFARAPFKGGEVYFTTVGSAMGETEEYGIERHMMPQGLN